MKKALILALLSFYALLSGVSHARDYKSMTVRIACSTPPGSVQAVPLEPLAEIVHNESNGRIKCELYTGGVLGDEQSVVKQLRGNEIQIGVLAAGNLTPFAPKATLVILPYMFPSKQHAFRFFQNEAFMKTFNEAITEQSKTRPLGWLIGGYRVLTNSRRPIRTIDDMAGLKWRVPPVELQLAAFRSWGVEPHPLPWIETFNGLQQGVIDGQENPHLIRACPPDSGGDGRRSPGGNRFWHCGSACFARHGYRHPGSPRNAPWRKLRQTPGELRRARFASAP